MELQTFDHQVFKQTMSVRNKTENPKFFILIVLYLLKYELTAEFAMLRPKLKEVTDKYVRFTACGLL